MMAADLGPGAAHEWERREPGHWQRWRVEAAGGYGERRRRGGSRAKNADDGWEKKTRRYILGRSLVLGEATARD